MFNVLFVYWFIFATNLSESTPLSLLLATENGIKVFSSSTSDVKTIHNLSASAVDFRFPHNEIFFIARRQIFYSYFSQYIEGRSEPIPTVTADYAISDLAVDWVNYRVYYSVRATHSIYMVALLGGYSQTIVNQVIDVHELALDPYERLLFCISDNKLQSFDLETHQLYRKYDFSVENISHVFHVVVNIHRQEVVVVGTGEDGHWRMVSADYLFSHATLLAADPLLDQTSSLAVFSDHVVWSTGHTLYWCQLLPECNTSSITLVYESDETITDVKVYSPLVQTPSTQAACQLCSHSCVVSTAVSISCDCPQHMQLQPNGYVCEDKATTSWNKWIRDLVETCSHWMDSLSDYLKAAIFVFCGLMITLLTCCLCLLITRTKPDHQETRESYSLSETNHSCKHGRLKVQEPIS